MQIIKSENNTGRTILLTIKGTHFLLESDKPLTVEDKNEIELLCQMAYEETSDFISTLGEDKTLDDLYEISVYEMALIAQKVFYDKAGISVSFRPLDLECSINATGGF